MNRRTIKKQIFFLLENLSWIELKAELRKFEPQDIIHPLFSALCSSNERIKWHAVSAFGVVVSKIAEKDVESARIIMRRFLWSLNDESGGIGWGVPEAMGETMACSEILFNEYGQLLISYMREDGPELFQDGNFLELPALQQGVLWAVGRLLETRRELMLTMDVSDDLEKYLFSEDHVVCAMAAFCLGKCGSAHEINRLKELTEDQFSFNFYRNGRLEKTSVAYIASKAIEEMNSKQMLLDSI
jgi:hypothetical protein